MLWFQGKRNGVNQLAMAKHQNLQSLSCIKFFAAPFTHKRHGFHLNAHLLIQVIQFNKIFCSLGFRNGSLWTSWKP